MTPFYASPDGRITVFNARCEDVLAAGLVPLREVTLIHADPPYGIGLDTKRRGDGKLKLIGKRNGRRRGGHSWPTIPGDDQPYDPAPILALDRPTVLWGANHYSSRVPGSPSWIFWDKRCEGPEIDNACGEMAWSNLGGPVRRFSYLWRGLLRGSHRGGKHADGRPMFEQHLHPTEKPIALCSWVYQRAKLKPGDLVFVPYLGSGPDLPAAQAMGLKIVACDVERWCCDTAIGRLGAITPERAAEPVGPLFRGAP